jgi:polyisoprenoid-binding protein YceI
MTLQLGTELTSLTSNGEDLEKLLGVWAVDPVHSQVAFAARHLGIGTVRGQFERYQGTVAVAGTPPVARVTGAIEASSLNTGFEMRDTHLRSADFFDVENHPEIVFTTKDITLSAGGTFDVTGDLTVRGVTREIGLTGQLAGTAVDQFGNQRLALCVIGQLDRNQFDLPYNESVAGIPVVGDVVQLTLDIEAIKQS